MPEMDLAVSGLLMYYFDKIAALTRHFGQIDLSDCDLPIRFSYMKGREGVDCTEYFLDRVSWLEEGAVAFDVTGMSDDPDKYTLQTIEAAQIVRVPGTERRFVVTGERLLACDPLVDVLSLATLLHHLLCKVRGKDGEQSAADMPFDKDEYTRILNDLEQFFCRLDDGQVRGKGMTSNP